MRRRESTQNEVVSQAEVEIRNHYPNLAVDLTTKIIVGSPKQAIVEDSKNWGADRIFVRSHGYGFWQKAARVGFRFGNDHAPCPIFVVRGSPMYARLASG